MSSSLARLLVGMVQGLIHDVPTVRGLIDRIVREAEAIIRGRLARMVQAPKLLSVRAGTRSCPRLGPARAYSAGMATLLAGAAMSRAEAATLRPAAMPNSSTGRCRTSASPATARPATVIVAQ